MNAFAIVFILAGLLIVGVIIVVIVYIVIRYNKKAGQDQFANADIYLTSTNKTDITGLAKGTYIAFAKPDLSYDITVTDYFTYYDKASGSIPEGAIQYYGVSNKTVVLTVDMKAKDPMSFSVYKNGSPDGLPSVSTDPTIPTSQDVNLSRNYTLNNGDWICLMCEADNSTILKNSFYKLERPSSK